MLLCIPPESQCVSLRNFSRALVYLLLTLPPGPPGGNYGGTGASYGSHQAGSTGIGGGGYGGSLSQGINSAPAYSGSSGSGYGSYAGGMGGPTIPRPAAPAFQAGQVIFSLPACRCRLLQLWVPYVEAECWTPCSLFAQGNALLCVQYQSEVAVMASKTGWIHMDMKYCHPKQCTYTRAWA